MTQRIELTGGHVAMVDNDDFAWLSTAKWYATECNGHIYARSWWRGENVYMHRLILGAGPGQEVDHDNGVKLDNRRANLRLCTHSLNIVNRAYERSVSPYRGVYQQRSRRGTPGRWVARVTLAGKTHRSGGHLTPEAAAHAYDVMARAHHSEFARLNFPAEGRAA